MPTRLFAFPVALTLMALGLSGCGDDESNGGGGGPSLGGTVRNFIYDEPVAGIAVGAGNGASTISGADGSFSLPGVEAPYDLLSATPVVGGGLIFVGYSDGTQANPALGAVPAGWNNPSPKRAVGSDTLLPVAKNYAEDAAEIDVTLSGADASGNSIRIAVGDGSRTTARAASAGASNFNGIVRSWSRAPLHTVNVAALQLDSSDEFRYARQNGVVLAQNTTGNDVSLSLSAVPTAAGTIGVSISAPPSHSFTNVTWTAYTVVDGLPLRASSITTASGSLRVPSLAGATHLVYVSAGLEDGAAEPAGDFSAVRVNVAAGSNVTLEAAVAPTLSAPSDGAINQPADPVFDFTPSPGAEKTLFQLFGSEPYGELTQNWILFLPGGATALEFPNMPAIGAVLFSNSNMEWGTISLLSGWDDLDAANVLRVFAAANSPNDDLDAALANDRAHATSEFFEFTTGTN